MQQKRHKNKKLDPKTNLPVKITKLNLRSNRDILEDEKEQAIYVGKTDMLEKFESSRYDKHMGVLKPKDVKLAHEEEKELMLEKKSIDLLNDFVGKKDKKKKKEKKKKRSKSKRKKTKKGKE